MTIPQSMGYALLAAVPGYYGLYTSLFPVIIYFLFGTSRHVSIGTMALGSLVIRTAIEKEVGQKVGHTSAENNSITAE
jgi:MFS superfamily sulfate permease-like transporter